MKSRFILAQSMEALSLEPAGVRRLGGVAIVGLAGVGNFPTHQLLEPGVAHVVVPQGTPRARADVVLDTLRIFVPRRLADEEIGDAFELIVEKDLRGWRLWGKVASTVFWVLVNGVRECVAAIVGKRKGGG